MVLGKKIKTKYKHKGLYSAFAAVWHPPAYSVTTKLPGVPGWSEPPGWSAASALLTDWHSPGCLSLCWLLSALLVVRRLPRYSMTSWSLGTLWALRAILTTRRLHACSTSSWLVGTFLVFGVALHRLATLLAVQRPPNNSTPSLLLDALMAARYRTG